MLIQHLGLGLLVSGGILAMRITNQATAIPHTEVDCIPGTMQNRFRHRTVLRLV